MRLGQEEHILVNEYSKSVSQISLSPNGQTVGFVALNQEDEYMLINSTTQKSINLLMKAIIFIGKTEVLIYTMTH